MKIVMKTIIAGRYNAKPGEQITLDEETGSRLLAKGLAVEVIEAPEQEEVRDVTATVGFKGSEKKTRTKKKVRETKKGTN